MILKNKFETFAFTAALLLASSNAAFGFFNVGKSFNCNGSFSSQSQLDLAPSESFSGKGTLTAPVINITTKTFGFTGTINCEQKCTIITKEAFDQNMFKREGGGEFIIILDSPKIIAINNDIKIALQDKVQIDFANAIENNDLEQFATSIKDNPKEAAENLTTLMVIAATYNNINIVKDLIELDADINALVFQRTPLFYAVMLKNTELVKILIQAGADVSITDEYGKSILDIAKENEVNEEIIQLLSDALNK